MAGARLTGTGISTPSGSAKSLREISTARTERPMETLTYTPKRAEPKEVTPYLIREMRAGLLDLAKLPLALRNQLQAIARRMARQEARYIKRETRAMKYRAAPGNLECARRRRQIAAGSLRVENGLVA